MWIRKIQNEAKKNVHTTEPTQTSTVRYGVHQFECVRTVFVCMRLPFRGASKWIGCLCMCVRNEVIDFSVCFFFAFLFMFMELLWSTYKPSPLHYLHLSISIHFFVSPIHSATLPFEATIFANRIVVSQTLIVFHWTRLYQLLPLSCMCMRTCECVCVFCTKVRIELAMNNMWDRVRQREWPISLADVVVDAFTPIHIQVLYKAQQQQHLKPRRTTKT